MINSSMLNAAGYSSGKATNSVVYKDADKYYQRKIYDKNGILKYFITLLEYDFRHLRGINNLSYMLDLRFYNKYNIQHCIQLSTESFNRVDELEAYVEEMWSKLDFIYDPHNT